jgi:isoquinoline 1-oxidoreductase beta subunit
LNQAQRVDGTAKFGVDVRVPNMVFASIRAAPVFGAKLASVDPAPAMAVAGVVKVVKLEDAVAVVAKSTWAAFKGVEALSPQWTAAPIAQSTPETTAKLRQHSTFVVTHPAENGEAAKRQIKAAIAAAPKTVEAMYEEVHVIHAAMEPMNCTAHVTADKVELWVPTQSPTRALEMAASTLGRDPGTIKVNPTLMGGGFGRRGQVDYVRQAVLIAKDVPNPVQLVWTREEDMTHGRYRPQLRQTYRGGLDADGTLSSYECESVSSDNQVERGSWPKPYTVPKAVVNAGVVKTGVPFGAWRSVQDGQTAFGRESFVDECAHAAGADPVEYRLKLLGENERAKRLVRAVADAIDWKAKRPKGTAVGVAVHECFDSVVAHAVEVEVKDNAIKVKRVVVAGDMGRTVTPGPAEAQYQGGVLWGLSAALGEAMSFTNGAADQKNFSTYKILRQKQTPPVKVMFFETPGAIIGGAGEPPLPGVAPALANAVFAATGKRVRSLPFSAQGFKV